MQYRKKRETLNTHIWNSNLIDSPILSIQYKKKTKKGRIKKKLFELRVCKSKKELEFRPELNKSNLNDANENLKKYIPSLSMKSKSSVTPQVYIVKKKKKPHPLVELNKKIYNHIAESMKPFNIFFKKETLKMKKARKQKELVYLNKKNYNSIDSTLKDYNLDKSLFIKPLENSFFKFDDFLNKSQNIVYNFNNKKRLMLSNINSLLQDAFNTMGSLVNKPVLEIGPKKILIYLLFFYKKIKISRYLKNKKKKAKKLLLLKKKSSLILILVLAKHY